MTATLQALHYQAMAEKTKKAEPFTLRETNHHPWLKLAGYVALCAILSAAAWTLFGPGFTAWVDEVLLGFDWLYSLFF